MNCWLTVRKGLEAAGGIMKLEFDEKAYQDYLSKQEYPSNTRMRAEGVSLLDVLIEEQERMIKTEEGKRLFETIAAL
jgi:hypothetical protein